MYRLLLSGQGRNEYVTYMLVPDVQVRRDLPPGPTNTVQVPDLGRLGLHGLNFLGLCTGQFLVGRGLVGLRGHNVCPFGHLVNFNSQ